MSTPESRGLRAATRDRRPGARRASLGRLCVSLLFGGLVLVAPGDAAAGRNNYYKYRDEHGVLHITNTRRSEGEWKLWKSFEGSGAGRSGAHGDGGGSGRVALTGERARRYDTYIRDAARRYQLPEAFVRAVMHTESRYNPNAVSHAGAMGLMQLMPKTAKFLGVTQPFDPRQNIYGGCKLLRLLANRFNGDMILVAAGYNAGAGAVQKYGGVPPFVETRNYVKAVLRRYYAYERQSQLGGGAARRGPARNIAG